MWYWIDNLWKDMLETAKIWEQFIEDKTWKSIDYFTDSEKAETTTSQQKLKETENQKWEQEEQIISETKSEIIDLNNNIILIKIKTQLSKEFESLKSKINWVNNFLLSKDEKKKKIDELNKKYNEILTKLDKCNNDWELKTIYLEIMVDLKKWSDFLVAQEQEDILSDTIIWLNNIRIDLSNNFWTVELIAQTKQDVEKTKKEIITKKENSMESILTKIWIPAWIAWILAWFLAMLWFDWKSKEWWIFNTVIAFVKNPVEWFKNLIWFGSKKEDKETSEQEETIAKWEIKPNWNFVTYTNTNIEIKTKDKNIEYIKINWKNYKTNLENIWEVTFVQKNWKDYIVIWEKEIDLFTFIETTKENKDEYLLSQNFSDWNNLKLEIKS